MKDQLFWNRNNEEGFFDVSLASGAYFQEELVGRGSAFADYDNDGDLDLIITNNCGPAKLLRNDGGDKSNWLQIKVISGDNSFVGGVKVKIVTGNATQIREIGTEGSYLSQNSMVQHFGLSSQGNIDSLIISWPDGQKTMKANVQGNQILSIADHD